MIHMNLFTKQKQTHRHRKKKKTMVTKVINSNIHTTIYKIDNQQGPTVKHRENYSISYKNNLL